MPNISMALWMRGLSPANPKKDNALALEPQAPAAVETAAIPNPFAALGLAPELLAAVADLGFSEPTAVQQSHSNIKRESEFLDYSDDNETDAVSSEEKAAELELAEYLNDRQTCSNPLDFRKDRTKFQRLVCLPRSILCDPATTVG